MKYIKSIFVIALGILFPILAIAQDGPKPVYMSPEGKLYIKSKQPIYLRLSTSANDNAQSYLLKSEASGSNQPKSFSFEGHGRHTIQHAADHRIPQKNKEQHLFYVHDDGKSPRTKLSVTKAPWVYNGGVNIYGKPGVKISLKTKDQGSGVFASYYAMDSGSYSKYSTPIKLELEADYKLQFYALDNVGNKSKVRTRLYSLDYTAPVTKHKIVGGYISLDNGLEVLSPKSKIRLKSRDEKAGVKQIRYRFKKKKGIYKGRLLTMNGLRDGNHTLIYAAEDRVENDENNKKFTFYLDSIPPVVSHSLLGDQYRKNKKLYVSGRTTVELSATDNKAGLRRIRYFLRSKSGKIYNSPFTFPRKNGRIMYSYAASDNVINISKTVKKSVIVDISSPKVLPTFKGEHYFSRKTHYIRLSTRIKLSTTDNLSGIKSVAYSVDTDPEMSYKRSFSIKTEGVHSLAYTATDNVNNIKKQKIKLFVDEKAPEIYHHFSVNPTVPATDAYPLKSLLYLAATDKQSGIRNIYYSINGKKEIKYKKPLSFRKRMTYNIKIRAIDNVGNVSRSSVAFKIK